jgi:ankyrin repeat protein
MVASKYGHINVVKALLENNADLNLVDNNNFTALYYAVFYGHVNVVNLLISSGVNINIRKSLLQSALKKKNSYMDVITRMYESKKVDIMRKIK